MRKALILLLAVIILMMACFVTAIPWVNEGRDDVIWKEETLQGDRSAITGLHIQTRNDYRSRLLWTSEAVLGGEPEPETEFRFSNGAFVSEHEVTYSGITLDMYYDFTSYSNGSIDGLNENVPEKYHALLQKFQENYDNAPMGVDTTFSVDLKDYLEYYPLSGMMDIPGSTWPILDIFEHFRYADPINIELALKINDYFRIPMEESFILEYSVNKSESGTSMGIHSSWDIYLNSASVLTEDTCYLTFNALQEDGSALDTSLIPGGYGIYAIDLDTDENGDQTPVPESLRMVYPMDPCEGFIDMTASHDGQRIFMQTHKDGDLMLTVLDIASMTAIQKLCLMEDWEEYDHFLRFEDGYICLLSEDPNRYDSIRITVYEEQPDHTFSRVIHVKPDDPQLSEIQWADMLRWYFSEGSMAYNGETLVIVQPTREPDDWFGFTQKGCDFLIVAYTAEGMVYAGSYQVNLTELSSTIDRFDGNSPEIWW